MNFDTMSEAELDAYLSQDSKQANNKPNKPMNFDTMSEAELDAYLSQDSIPNNTKDVVEKDKAYDKISTADRLLIKNLGGDNQGIINYLQKNYPESEFKMDDDNEVIARDRGVNDSWKRMDPEMTMGNFFSTETLKDIGDLGYDVASGAVETGASIGGGILGTAAGPAGTVGGAMAGAGAAGSSTEALRQKLAQWAGTQEGDIDYGDVAISGAVSGTLAPIAGIGKVGKMGSKIINKLAKNPVEEAAMKSSLGKLEKGLVEKGIALAAKGTTKMAGKAGSVLSQATPERLTNFFKKNMDSWTDSDIIKMTNDLFDRIEMVPDRIKADATSLYDEASKSGKVVDISETRDIIKKRFDEAIDTYRDEPRILNILEKRKKETLGYLGERGSTEIPIQRAMLAKEKLGIQEDMKAMDVDTRAIFGRVIMGIKKDAKKSLVKSLRASDSRVGKADSLWKEAREVKDLINSSARNADTLYTRAEGIASKTGSKFPKIERLKKIDKDYGTNFEEVANDIYDWKLLKDPSWLPPTGTAFSVLRGSVASGMAGVMGAGPLGQLLSFGGAMLMGSPKGAKKLTKGALGIGKAGAALSEKATNIGEFERRAIWNSLINKNRE